MEVLRLLPADRPGADDAEFVRQLAADQGAAGPCPDENALAAFAEGRLAATARESIERHASACPDCQEVLAGLASAPLLRTVPASRWAVRAILAAAALVLIAFAVHRLVRPPRPVAERLEVAARQLAETESALFAGLPLSDDELGRAPGDGTRGAADVARPGGVLLASPSNIRWTARPVSSAWRCTLFDASGREVWQVETTSTDLPWPADSAPLAPGEYVFEAVADAVAGTAEVRGRFAIADDAQRTRLAAAQRALRAIGVPERDILLAQWALREDLHKIAVDAARAAWSDPDGRVAARLTLRAALLRAGETEEAAELEARER